MDPDLMAEYSKMGMLSRRDPSVCVDASLPHVFGREHLEALLRFIRAENGVVEERGTFDSLMQQKGYSYSLFTVSQKE